VVLDKWRICVRCHALRRPWIGTCAIRSIATRWAFWALFITVHFNFAQFIPDLREKGIGARSSEIIGSKVNRRDPEKSHLH
jgi:hypothetical protein